MLGTSEKKAERIRVMKRNKGGWIIAVLGILLQMACRTDQATNIPDVSDIRVDIDLTRFEQLLVADTTIDAVRLQQLTQQYPAFSKVYFDHVMPGADDLVTPEDPEVQMKRIQAWIRHPRTRWLYDTVQQVFPDLKDFEQGLTSAFTYARYYFPEKPTPRFFTTLSDFGYFPFIYSEDSLRDGIGISLEMFLGERFPYRQYNGLNNAFSDYLTRAYNKEHMVKRVLDIWLDDLMGPPPGNRLLDIMIHHGKKLYIEQCLLPATPDTVIMEYASPKLKWVKDNERNIWFQFTSRNLLYETSLQKIQKLVGPSPSSPGMPAESPGNTGSWLGWQIVRTYMKKYPSTTLQELIAMQDAQGLLDKSGYKPPR